MGDLALIADKNFDKIQLFSRQLRKSACRETTLYGDVAFPAA
jgi:hypothetical protein